MDPILISGSLAFDTIMEFPGLFTDKLPTDKLDALSVCFVVNKLKRSWGGTAGNIAFALKMLSGNPLVVSLVGQDGQPYLEHLEKYGIATSHIHQDLLEMTAAANITSDQAGNQITTYFSGSAAAVPFPETLANKPKIALVSPSSKATMLAHSAAAKFAGMTVVFDPGQQLNVFCATELQTMLAQADIVIGNEYEIPQLIKLSGWNEEQILASASLLITTLGKDGVHIQTNKGAQISGAACQVSQVLDPTGAGDCFRAGFFAGYTSGKSLEDSARMGSVSAAFCIEAVGPQGYTFSLKEFTERYHQNYQQEISL